MRRTLAVGVVLVASTLFVAAWSASGETETAISLLFGVSVPDGFRRWPFVAAAHETDPLNELRIVVGNDVAMGAYRDGTLPFPDGSVLVKLAWRRVQSDEFPAAFVPGEPTTVQVMVKDAKRYSGTGGWGFGRFIDGKAVDEEQHRTCFACHEPAVKDHDFVFTRYAR